MHCLSCVYPHVPFDLSSLFFGKVRSLVGRGVDQISSTPPVPLSALSGAYHHYRNPLIRASSCARVLQQPATDPPAEQHRSAAGWIRAGMQSRRSVCLIARPAEEHPVLPPGPFSSLNGKPSPCTLRALPNHHRALDSCGPGNCW